MPKEPVKYYELKIFTRIDFTDSCLLELIEKRPVLNEYISAIQRDDISSVNSQRILEFIANYDSGFFLPDKCDTCEPIRESFNAKDLKKPISWLSQPGSAVYLKKIKPFKYEGVIENERNAPIWEDRNAPLSIGVKVPYYLGYIWLHVDERIIKLKSKEYFFEFFKKLYENIQGEYGFIKDFEGQTILEEGK